MDLMSLRRGLMAQMGKSSILDGLLEIVDSVTVTEITNELQFNNVNKRGGYVIVSNPPGTIEQMLQEPNVLQYGLFSIAYFVLNGDPMVYRAATTVTIRPTMASSGYIDSWTNAGSINNGVLTIQPCSGDRKVLLPGYTYYLLRVKDI